MMLRVLTLATLFPDATRPNFGVFVERQTLGLAAEAGVEVRVVAPVGLPPRPLDRLARFGALRRLPARETWKGLSVERPRFTTVPGTAGRWHVAALERALVPVLDRLRRAFPFDVIDAEFFFPDGPVAVALGRHYGVPVSIKARGADIQYWGTAPATAGQVLAAGRAANGLLAVSEAMKRDMVALGMPVDNILVHRTGVDPAFHPRPGGAAKTAWGVDGPLVVSVGALIERKGHGVVIDAAAMLPDVRLLIAGEGPLRPALARQIAALGVGDRVRLLGSVPHGELPSLFAAADVMALASSSEGLANAWVEALASGTPVVTTDAGGARELIRDDDAGRVVARDAGAFAEAIAALMASPPEPARVAEAARAYRWERNAAALREHLAGLVGSGR